MATVTEIIALLLDVCESVSRGFIVFDNDAKGWRCAACNSFARPKDGIKHEDWCAVLRARAAVAKAKGEREG